MITHPLNTLSVHVVYYLVCVIVTMYLVSQPKPSLWLALVLGIVAGLYMEMANDAWLPESFVWYPEPHIVTLPGSHIPLSIVLGWGAFAVAIRLTTDRVHGLVVKTRHPLPRLLAYVFLLFAMSFVIGFAIEYLATLMGGWVYRYHRGVLLFPIWFSGPSTWLTVIPLVIGTSEILSCSLRKIAPHLRLQASGSGTNRTSP